MATIDTRRIFFFLVIFLFAGSVVALGSHELERHFRKHRAKITPVNGSEMVRALSGEVDQKVVKRAQQSNSGVEVVEERARPILPPIKTGLDSDTSEQHQKSSLEQFLDTMQSDKKH